MGHPFSKSSSVKSSLTEAFFEKCGKQEKQYRVDFTYQYELAKAASTNKVGMLILVSSAGADPNSRIFYSRMKGELDEAVQ